MKKNQEINFYRKQYIVTLYVTLSSSRTWALSAKFYDSYKLLISYQKSSNIKAKLKLMCTLAIRLH